ncbi:Non-specific serine/threonine protein kinase [Bertholletia excelsa]
MKASVGNEFALAFLFSSFLSMLILSYAADSLTANQTIGLGDTNVSAGQIFEFGLFSPALAERWYAGIWYKKISEKTVVWVANRDIPLTDPQGVLMVTPIGNIILLNSSGITIWSTNLPRPVQNPVAQLLDTGNLVVRDANETDPESFVWQSFDYPSDTLLPRMKLAMDFVRGLDRKMTSWMSTVDPSPGGFTYRLDHSGSPQLIRSSSTEVKSRSGPWNGLRFSGNQKANPIYRIGFEFTQEEVYYYYELRNCSALFRMVLSPEGVLHRFMWNDQASDWNLISRSPYDYCDTYVRCGPYSLCNVFNTSKCRCMNRFVQKDTSDWGRGCVRATPVDCRSGKDEFVKNSWVKLPDTRGSWFNTSMNLGECQEVCLKNCSCTAYTNSDIRGGGGGCLLWFGDLLDIKEFSDGSGQEIYVRVGTPKIDVHERTDESPLPKKQKKKPRRIIGIAASVISVGLVFIGLALLYVCKRESNRERTKGRTEPHTDSGSKEEMDHQLFDFHTLAAATNNFSDANKLGQGGFGPVYKGILMNGQEIAVKRLSKYSSQGLSEFKNEVRYISTPQHRNLVKLLGCCIQAEEKMLIYEYMANQSLDFFLFGLTLFKPIILSVVTLNFLESIPCVIGLLIKVFQMRSVG